MAGNNKRIVKKSSSDVVDAPKTENLIKDEQVIASKTVTESKNKQSKVNKVNKINKIKEEQVSEPVMNKVVDADIDNKEKSKKLTEGVEIAEVAEVAEVVEIPEKNMQTIESEMEIEIENESSENPENEPVTLSDKAKTKISLIPDELAKELKFRGDLTLLRREIGNYSKQLKDMKSLLRKLEVSYEHDIVKTLKLRPKPKRRNADDPTGFIKQIALSKELAELIGEEEKTMMSMPEYTKEFFRMMKEQKLLYEGDGRVFRANDRIKKVFNLPENVNESTNYRDKEGFNLYNLQSYISKVNDPVAYEKKHAPHD